MAALLLIPLLSTFALTVDVGYAYGQRRLAQNVADSAAINAAVVVGKRIQAATETWVKDGDVSAAITAIASRSSGGYTFGAPLRGEYVQWQSDGTVLKVGDVGTGVTCTSDGTAGCIPAAATGVRVIAQTTFNTFFAPILNRTTLSTGARAVALNAAVTGMNMRAPGMAPYALWTGENGPDGDGDGTSRSMTGGGVPPDFLCRNSGGNPIVLTVATNTFDAPAGSFRSASGKAYDYSCTGGTDNPIAEGTIFTIRSTPNFATPNVSVGNPNYQVTSSNFKGFIRIDSPSGFVGIGTYVSDGGIAGGNEDAGMDIIDACYQFNCTLVMPIVSYGVDDASSGHPRLLVTGFAAVKVREHNGVTINTENPTTASTSYEWKAMVVSSPVACCPVAFDYDVDPGETSLLLARLYQ